LKEVDLHIKSAKRNKTLPTENSVCGKLLFKNEVEIKILSGKLGNLLPLELLFKK
jgi:hypothetical protein